MFCGPVLPSRCGVPFPYCPALKKPVLFRHHYCLSNLIWQKLCGIALHIYQEEEEVPTMLVGICSVPSSVFASPAEDYLEKEVVAVAMVAPSALAWAFLGLCGLFQVRLQFLRNESTWVQSTDFSSPPTSQVRFQFLCDGGTWVQSTDLSSPPTSPSKVAASTYQSFLPGSPGHRGGLWDKWNHAAPRKLYFQLQGSQWSGIHWFHFLTVGLFICF